MSSTNPGPATTSTVNLIPNSGNFSHMQVISITLSPAAVAQGTTAEQAFSGLSTGLLAGDVIIGVSKPTAQAGLGIAGWRVDSAVNDKFYITFANVPGAGGSITPTASEVYTLVVCRPTATLTAVI